MARLAGGGGGREADLHEGVHEGVQEIFRGVLEGLVVCLALGHCLLAPLRELLEGHYLGLHQQHVRPEHLHSQLSLNHLKYQVRSSVV